MRTMIGRLPALVAVAWCAALFALSLAAYRVTPAGASVAEASSDGPPAPQSAARSPGVSAAVLQPASTAQGISAPAVALTGPESNGEIRVYTTPPEGIRTFAVQGTVKGVASSKALLLWVHPVEPPEAWYLQLPPRGVPLQPKGEWSGSGQIGNLDYPPSDGDRIELRVTMLDAAAANELLRKKVARHIEPLGETVASATNLTVRLK